jgi:hypothetical protein
LERALQRKQQRRYAAATAAAAAAAAGTSTPSSASTVSPAVGVGAAASLNPLAVNVMKSTPTWQLEPSQLLMSRRTVPKSRRRKYGQPDIDDTIADAPVGSEYIEVGDTGSGESGQSWTVAFGAAAPPSLFAEDRSVAPDRSLPPSQQIPVPVPVKKEEKKVEKSILGFLGFGGNKPAPPTSTAPAKTAGATAPAKGSESKGSAAKTVASATGGSSVAKKSINDTDNKNSFESSDPRVPRAPALEPSVAPATSSAKKSRTRFHWILSSSSTTSTTENKTSDTGEQQWTKVAQTVVCYYF